MQAIILAAGEGVRLRPYTLITPKVLLTIKGIPLLNYHIEKLNNLGISNEDIFVVCGYLKEEIEGFLRKFHPGVKIIEQIKNKKGTSAALESVESFIGREEILVLYGDIFYCDNLKNFYKLDYAIGVTEVEDVSKFGKVISKDGFLEEIREKSEGGRGEIFAGILKIKKDFFQALKEVKPNEKSGEYYLTDAILIYNKKRKFKVYKMNGYWLDIGSEEFLKKAREIQS
ncbi:MAG: nucleotidyltransferase family protein [Candidatus Aenigmatarchaeota archaeon]